ncbi:Uncharacterised protein [Mycobacteroides abscessus subsp. abscessus]|nr:Uncharacterised protein [Mycobacteroides abscessus subsp. abscessus]
MPSSISSRLMSLRYWRRSLRCWSPSYSMPTMTSCQPMSM